MKTHNLFIFEFPGCQNHNRRDPPDGRDIAKD
jgi:hypothetical protein